MNMDNHPDPITEGLSQSVQRLTQLAAATQLLRQSYAQHRQRLRDAKAAQDAAAEERVTRQLRAAFDDARTQWAPVHDREWLRNADLLQVGRAWSAAVPYEKDSNGAAQAVRVCEKRLRELHPHGMEQYDRFRHNGMSPADAMLKAAPFFAHDPRTRTSESPTREALNEGTGLTWTVTEHGPDRKEWEDRRQEQQARKIIDRLQEQHLANGQDRMRPQELRTVLEVTTNLPEHIITKAVRPEGTGDERDVPPGPAEVAAEDHPLTIDEAMEMSAGQPHERPSTGKPHNPVVDRNRRPSR
jgi:hypothetical protein